MTFGLRPRHKLIKGRTCT